MFLFLKKFFKGTLHKACEKGDTEAVKKHLAAGLDVNHKVKEERTALDYAIYGGHKEIVKLLITVVEVT